MSDESRTPRQDQSQAQSDGQQLPSLEEQILDLLLESGELTEQSLDRGRRAAHMNGERIDLVLNKLGLISDETLVAAWAALTGFPIAGKDKFPDEPVLAEILKGSYLLYARVLPLGFESDTLELALMDPLDDFSVRAIQAKTGKQVKRYLARPGELMVALEQLYDRKQPASFDGEIVSDSAFATDIELLRDQASDAPVIRLVSAIIDKAIEQRASDIHITAERGNTRIRYRLDGMLHDMQAPPPQFHAAIVSRLKIMAGMDIAEQRLPQDGRIRIVWRGREVDLRIATMPHLHGEGVVLRILDRSSIALDLPSLGFSEATVSSLQQVLRQPHGIFLVTGPTGSGKTTTLYAALKMLTDPNKNILTVEDPIEYQLDGITQIQVDQKIGLDFARVLRSVLRQDPDTIMVGEIRDRETAAIANQAALTGHFVLATLHTNTAVSALPRLVDMGVEPYLLASTLRATMAQRLVRRLCRHCRNETFTNGLEFRAISDIPSNGFSCFEPMGCQACQGTGYVGRSALTEFAPITAALRAGLLRHADEKELAEIATSEGLETMWHDGLTKVLSGDTSIAEVMRIMGSS